MQKITLVGNTGIYMRFEKDKELASGRKSDMLSFDLYCSNNKGESTRFRCVYLLSDGTKIKDALMIPKKKYTNENGKEVVEYYSRKLAIDGSLSVTTTKQSLPVVGFEDEYEEVYAPSITVFVGALEFLDPKPGDKNSSNNDTTTTGNKEELNARREARLARRQAQADSSEIVDEEARKLAESILDK